MAMRNSSVRNRLMRVLRQIMIERFEKQFVAEMFAEAYATPSRRRDKRNCRTSHLYSHNISSRSDGDCPAPKFADNLILIRANIVVQKDNRDLSILRPIALENKWQTIR